MITIDVPESWVESLRVIGNPEEVVSEMVDHAQQGVTRPGSWERPWLVQAFGDEFVGKLERDPDAHWRERPKVGDVDDGDYIAERVAEHDDQPDPPEEL